MKLEACNRDSLLRLRPSDLQPAVLELDGASHKELLSLEQRVGVLERAIHRIEQLTEDIAAHAGGDWVSPFCWSFTPDWRRPTDLQGDFFWIYIAETAGWLRKEMGISSLQIDLPCPDFLPRICQEEFGYKIAFNGKGTRRGRAGVFSRTWSTATEVMSAARLVRAFLRRKKSRECAAGSGDQRTGRILVKVPFEDPKVRYGDLLEVLGRDFELVAHYLDVEHKRELPSGYFRFLAFATPGAAMSSLFTSLRVVLRLARMRKKSAFSSFRNSAYLQPRLNDVLMRVLQYHCIGLALDAVSPVLVLTVSNFDRATERMMAALASERGIPCLYVLPHYLTDLRPSTRVMAFEVDRRRNPCAPLPSHMIALGEESREYLLEKGIQAGQVTVGGKSPALPPGDQDCLDATVTASILLLLPNERPESIALLRHLFSVREATRGFRLLVRSHPRLTLGPEERELASAIAPDWQDATGGDIFSALQPGMVTISLFSQAGLEGALWGAGPIWLPNISETALTMMHLMSRVGLVCRDAEELRSALLRLQSRDALSTFSRESKQKAIRMLGVKQSISEAFEELSLPLASRPVPG